MLIIFHIRLHIVNYTLKRLLAQWTHSLYLRKYKILIKNYMIFMNYEPLTTQVNT